MHRVDQSPSPHPFWKGGSAHPTKYSQRISERQLLLDPLDLFTGGSHGWRSSPFMHTSKQLRQVLGISLASIKRLATLGTYFWHDISELKGGAQVLEMLKPWLRKLLQMKHGLDLSTHSRRPRELLLSISCFSWCLRQSRAAAATMRSASNCIQLLEAKAGSNLVIQSSWQCYIKNF